eukprot:scaffold282842_cov33-Tisochrysis_lutea.AAC.1
MGNTLSRERSHGVEHDGEAPVLSLTSAAEHHVRLVQLDLLHADANAVSPSRASRRDGEGHALELESGCEHGRDRRAHRPRHTVRADPPQLSLIDGLHGLHHIRERGATLAQDTPNTGTVNVLRLEACILDAALHCDVGILGVRAHEACLLPVNKLIKVDLGPAADVRLHANLLVLGVKLDARLGLLQGGRHLQDREEERAAQTRMRRQALVRAASCAACGRARASRTK